MPFTPPNAPGKKKLAAKAHLCCARVKLRMKAKKKEGEMGAILIEPDMLAAELCSLRAHISVHVLHCLSRKNLGVIGWF